MNKVIFDSMLDAAVVLDREGKSLYGNAAAAQLFDVSQKRLEGGRLLTDLIQFQQPEMFSPERLAGLQSATPYAETGFTSRSGVEGWAQISMQPFNENEVVIFLRDVSLEQTLQRKYRSELSQKEQYISELECAREELEKYSKNLEVMVAERTAELREANQLLRAILDSLGEGFFVFNREGECLSVYSRICEDILETSPSQKHVADVLRVPDFERDGFSSWISALFDEVLPFEDLKPLGPNLFPSAHRLRVELQYAAMRGDTGQIEGVVVVASDKSSEFEAKQEAAREKALARMVLKVLENRPQFLRFLGEAEGLIRQTLESVRLGQVNWADVTRALHTLKGGAGTFSLKALHDHAHELEDWITEAVREAGVKTEQLQRVVEGCQVLQSDLNQFQKDYGFLVQGARASGERRVEVEVSKLVRWSHQQASGTVLREMMDAALEPMTQLLQPYVNMCQEIAEGLGKKLEPLSLSGAELRIYAPPYEPLFASFVHLFRNAIDHGIEIPDVRSAHGKSVQGRLSVRIETREKRLRLIVADDGAGIDLKKIRRKLETRGETTERLASLSDHEMIQHIFDPGFSTRDEVSALSGRGIGLDAVKANVLALGGTIEVFSETGQGTRFEMDLPLIASISPETLSRSA